MAIRSLVLTITIGLLLSGCSSFQTKSLPLIVPTSETSGTPWIKNEEALWGHPYTGVQQNMIWWDCIAFFNEEFNAFGTFVIIAYGPMATIDFILSAVTDTVFLPIDLAVDAKYENNINQECFSDWKFSSKEI